MSSNYALCRINGIRYPIFCSMWLCIFLKSYFGTFRYVSVTKFETKTDVKTFLVNHFLFPVYRFICACHGIKVYFLSKGNAIFEQKNQLYLYKTTSYKIVPIRIPRPMSTNITEVGPWTVVIGRRVTECSSNQNM